MKENVASRRNASAETASHGRSADKKENLDELKVPMGLAIITVAETYPRLQLVILELIQNSLDVDAMKVSVSINLKNRTLAVQDNGIGVSTDNFRVALRSVCRSLKIDKEDKFGKYGKGMVSPLSVADEFTFISFSPVEKECNQWTFVKEKIREQEDKVFIPRVLRSDITQKKLKRGKYLKRHPSPCWWNTQVDVRGIIPDKTKTEISLSWLEGEIQKRYSKGMIRLGSVIDIELTHPDGRVVRKKGIKGKQFSGKALPPVELYEACAGKILFRIYVSRWVKDRRSGTILLGQGKNPFRLALSRSFAYHAKGLLDEETIAVLLSGFFEGEIIADQVKLDTGRERLEVDDAFTGFCACIDEWYKEYGKPHYDEAHRDKRGEYYSNVCAKSLKKVAALFEQEEFAHLKKMIQDFSFGSVGRGHTPPDPKNVVGEMSAKSISSDTEGDGKRDHSGIGGKPKKERPKHQPFTVSDNSGRRKRLTVKNSSLGLQFCPTIMEGSDQAYYLDTEEGVLYFNMRHPTIVAVEESERLLAFLFEKYAIQALLLSPFEDDEWHGILVEFLRDENSAFVYLLKGILKN